MKQESEIRKEAQADDVAKTQLAAVILAGGYSSRMRQFKPLLHCQGSTVIANVVRTFAETAIEEIIVVAGHNADELRQGLNPQTARVIFNPEYGRGMYSSVVAGIGAISRQYDGALLIPVDMPFVRSHTVVALCAAFAHTGAAVVYPLFQCRRGHPTVISARLFPEILTGDGEGGLRALLRRHEEEACELPVVDEGVITDLDTPEDHALAREKFGDRTFPTPAECDAILAGMELSPTVVAHCRRVAEVALRLALGLNAAGLSLHTARIRSAALLHDLAKDQLDHALAGALVLKEVGFDAVARLVAAHSDTRFQEGDRIDEEAIVFLADKLVLGDRLVSLDERYREKLDRSTMEAAPRIRRQWQSAQAMTQTIQRLSGMDLLTLVSRTA